MLEVGQGDAVLCVATIEVSGKLAEDKTGFEEYAGIFVLIQV